ARAAARRERAERQRARAQAWSTRRAELGLRARGVALEARRRLRPLGRAFAPLGSLLRGWMGRIAPYFSRTLMLMVSLPAALIALLLRFAQVVLGWIRARTVPAACATGRFLSIHVRPASTVAFVAAAAAVALGVSQFFDYSGVEVSASLYAGEVGTTAPVPLTGLERAGDAHLWVLVAVAVAALVLVVQTYRGHWRLGRLVGALGLFAVLVSLAIDLPQGLDAGRAGIAFSDTRAELIEGFWAQLSAAVALVFCGPLLGAYVRRASAPDSLRPRGRERSWSLSGRRRRSREARPVVAARGEAHS
ncbi:MAG: hypothetical protein ACRDK5_01290, partial [Solirubrobacterales bacterium]